MKKGHRKCGPTVPEDARGRAYARLYWASNIGAGVAGSVGTLIADRHMTALFYVAAASTEVELVVS
ncbi:hypothetical protein ACGRHY_27040 [Streptomyces sp. HK10]|uniref:hypothetical protein n=1 Tax=Streptomyces sp. HK10 TaxID=3373255 RepID=UPI00374A74B5